MATATRMQEVTLHCTEGTSDKLYTIWIEPDGDLFRIKALYGARGSHMSPADKTPKTGPVPLEKAKKVYDGVLKEKYAKGYVVYGSAAPAFTHVEGASDTGLRPMLLTDMSGEDPEPFLVNEGWVAQQKMNGKRIMLKVDEKGEVFGVNRRGLKCPIPAEIEKTLPTHSLQVTFDGELIGGVYYAFDLLETGGLDRRPEPYADRHKWLKKILATLPRSAAVIKLVEIAGGACDKRELYHQLQRDRKEGIVFKKLNAPYTPGRIEDPKKAIAVKVKFYAEVAAVVIRWTDKNSVEVGLRPDDREGNMIKPVSVGKVTVPTKYAAQVKEGAIIRVRYLYATAGKQLYQANLDPDDSGIVGADSGVADTIDKLKFEGKEEE